MELVGCKLVVTGTELSIDRAKKYVNILLDQRRGDVIVTTGEKEDLTLLDIPNDCKGFVTGRGGDTLRQIERECATLMTFCKTDGRDDREREPLAIFGTRRARLMAKLKIMSVVEGKHRGWFCQGKDPPEVDISRIDEDEGDDGWGVSYKELDPDILGYALGKRGDTRIKLEVASGCIIQYIGRWAAFGGTESEQKRGKTYLTWLLNQRKPQFVVPDVEGRDDVSVLWVPESSVGYVTGIKAKTLRNLENKTGTFCFFDRRAGDTARRDKEKMLIFSSRDDHREKAVEEVRSIVDFHQRKIQGNGRVSLRERSDTRSMSRSESRSKSRSASRSRSSAMSEDRGRVKDED